MIQWTQNDELNFLDSIGIHRDKSPKELADVPQVERRRLLHGYLTATDLPREWFPNADVRTLRAHAQGLIEKSYEIEREQHERKNECNPPLLKN